MLVFFYLTVINWLLNKLNPSPVSQSAISAPAPKEIASPASQVNRYPYNVAGLALVVLAVTVTVHLGHTQPVPLVQNFDRFPLKIGNWEGSRGYLEPDIIKVLETDEYLEVNYVNPQPGPVSLWIAYYPANYKEKGIGHYPEACLVGAGWKIVRDQQIELAPGLPVNYLLVERSGARQVVYYWYLQNNRWIANQTSFKIYLTLDAVLTRRNNGALIRLMAPVVSNVEDAEARLRSFAQPLLPALQQFFHMDKSPGPTVRFDKAEGKAEN
jgi:EpsI family protein